MLHLHRDGGQVSDTRGTVAVPCRASRWETRTRRLRLLWIYAGILLGIASLPICALEAALACFGCLVAIVIVLPQISDLPLSIFLSAMSLVMAGGAVFGVFFQLTIIWAHTPPWWLVVGSIVCLLAATGSFWKAYQCNLGLIVLRPR